MQPAHRPGNRDARRAGPGDTGTFLVAAVALGMIVARVLQQIVRGPGWDTYGFLANAAEFAGKGFGYTEPHRPPMISMITGLLFRFVPLDEVWILWVDGALSLLGIIALYALFRRRFEKPYAAAGALAMLAIPSLWDYLGRGYTDFASVALAALALLLLVRATEDSSRWYYLAIPTLVAAGLMRFNTLMLVLPMIMWIVMRSRPFRHARQILAGAALSLLVYAQPAALYLARYSDILFPFTTALGMVETATTAGGQSNLGESAAGGWYALNTPALLGGERIQAAAVVVLLIALTGLMLAAVRYFDRHRPTRARWFFAALGVAATLLGQTGGSLIIRQAGLALGVFIVWYSLAPRDEDSLRRITWHSALDAVMLLWMLAYADYNARLFVIVPRYFIPMAPGLLYFVLRGTAALADAIRAYPSDRPRVRSPLVASAPVAALSAFVMLGLILTVVSPPVEPDRLVQGARSSAEWLVSAGVDLDAVTVYSDLWPLTSWYTRSDVRPMPSFADDRAYAHEIDKYGIDYYVTIRSTDYERMEERFEDSSVRVLTRTPSESPSSDMPRILYLGKAWDNYLEEATDFSFYLLSTAGRYGREGSAYADALTADELAAYDAVAAYRFRWHSRAAADRTLEEYVREGGTLLVDASGNLSDIENSLRDTVLLETIVRRGLIAENARIELSPAFAEAHGLPVELDGSPFLSEDGSEWYGAAYERLPTVEGTRTVIATVDDAPLITVQELGRGRVYWIAGNLAWHAYHYEDAGERALLGALFAEALAPTGDAR